MASKVRSRAGVTPREKIRLAVMIGGVVVVVAIVVQTLGLLGGDTHDRPGLALVDPDETTALPDYDREFLADVVDSPSRSGPPYERPIMALLDLVDTNADVFSVTGRGFRQPTAAELRAAPAASRGDLVKIIGRVSDLSTRRMRADRPEVHRFALKTADGGRFVVFSTDPVAEKAGSVFKVLKVLGMFLRIGPESPDGAEGPLEVVAIRLIHSVMPERFEHIDPNWFRLVREETMADRENLRTEAIFLVLAWARTLGPDGLAQRLENGRLTLEDMPTSDEVHLHHDRLQGRLFEVRGTLDGIFGDHGIPENRAGLESVYRLEVVHDLGGRRVFPVVALAPRTALPATLHAGDRIVLEGLYLKIWTTTDAQGALIHKPMLIAPRVRHADAPDTEER